MVFSIMLTNKNILEIPVMKKAILSAFILISVFTFTIGAHASYIIHLKGGGQYITSQYWEEDGQVKFFVSGGTMGIDKDTVRKIEKSNLSPDESNEMTKPEKVSPQINGTPDNTTTNAALPSAGNGEAVDLKAYQDKMDRLKHDLNKTLARIKKANMNKDTDAKDEATEENRRLSTEMWKLTDELKEKNNGKLPADWWEGVGKEQP